MKPELTLTKEQMDNFCINVVNNFEGCPEASVFLKKIYGEEVTDLRTRKKDFETLVKMGKSPWIINFLLNTITKEYRAGFLKKLVSENIWLLEDDALKLRVVATMNNLVEYASNPTSGLYTELTTDYEYLNTKREEVKLAIKGIDNRAISSNETKFEKLMTESQFLKGLLFFMLELEGNFTRSVVKFCQSLSESIQWKFMREDSVDYNKKTMESCGYSLIDYVGYFVVSAEKRIE